MNNKKRILLVEDDPNFGIILRDFLKMNEYDVILAKNGMEGFEKFKKFEFLEFFPKGSKFKAPHKGSEVVKSFLTFFD